MRYSSEKTKKNQPVSRGC